MIVYFFKTLHIIGFTAWFGGLFYLVRILVYHNEALSKSAEEKEVLIPQYQLMEQRVARIICQPAMMFTWACGLTMLALNPSYLQFGWIHTKLFFLVLLTAYHMHVVRLPKQLSSSDKTYSDLHFRIMNEVPTIILAVIVGLAVFKTAVNYYYLFGGVLAFIGMIAWGIIAYQKKRKREESGQ